MLEIFSPTRATQLLKNFQSVAEDNNFFDPGFSVQQMDHIPDLYRSIIDDPAALHNAFEQAQGEGNFLNFFIVTYNIFFRNCLLFKISIRFLKFIILIILAFIFTYL